jgi:hypothetical protein
MTPAGGQPTPGVVSIQARTDANKETRTVFISNIKVIDVRFPSADEASATKLEVFWRSRAPSIEQSGNENQFLKDVCQDSFAFLTYGLRQEEKHDR